MLFAFGIVGISFMQTGLDKAATAKVYSMTGGLVYEGIIANHSALELPIEEGVYLIVVDKAIQKLIIK